MTKRFCDICGKPSYEKSLEVSMVVGKKWRGLCFDSGQGIEGCWEPRISLSAGIVSENLSQEDNRIRQNRDLCRECLLKLAEKLVETLKATE